MVNWESVRAEFAALDRWTYLNTATFGLLPKRSEDAISEHLARRNERVCSDFIDWFDDMDKIRALAAQLIHAEPEDIGFVPNASSALSLLMGGMEWQPGDRIVTLENEFPNNLYFPAMLASRGVDFIEASANGLLEAIDGRTRLVLLSLMNYSDGYRPALTEIATKARECGCTLYVDGTQGLGPLQFDVRAVQPEMFVAHAYKWLLSPNGAGFVYVSPQLRKTLQPNVVGWRSDKRWREVDQLHHGAPEFKDSAERYEGGMLNFVSLYAMGKSLELFLELDPANIEARVLELSRHCAAILENAVASIAYKDSPILAARFGDRDVSALARTLREQKIVVAARRGYLRVSVHLYNNEDDLEKLRRALA